MTRGKTGRGTSSASRPGKGAGAGAGAPPRIELLAVTLLLALHVTLAVWVATRNSVTFDENFHLPAGVVALTRADFSSSYAQPPLARSLYALAALAAGARLPDPAIASPGNERGLGESFMRRNADRYQRVFLAGRLVAVALSTLLAALIWRAARSRYGVTAGLVALTAWSCSPEALAHGSLTGVDVPTALTFFGAILAGSRWLESGRFRHWLWCALWLAAAFLVRFSAVQVPVALGLLAVWFAFRGRLASCPRAVVGLVALGVVAWLAVNAGYLFQGFGTPLGHIELHSPPFVALARRFGTMPVLLPEPYLRGLDYLASLAQPGLKTGYLLGEFTKRADWRYFPVAIAVKWPVGLLVLIALRAVGSLLRREARAATDAVLLVPALVVVGSAMSSNLGFGVRYLLPALPFLIVWGSGLAKPGASVASKPGGAGGMWRTVAVVLALAIPLEAARALPYPLSFFNSFASAPGAGERVVNDSNVDWGQGLIALRDDMRRLGIRRVHLSYHGTTDPSIYGIDHVTYTGDMPGPESDWLAISSYFYVGLPARVLTPDGYTAEPVRLDARALWSRSAATHPAGCMWLFRLR